MKKWSWRHRRSIYSSAAVIKVFSPGLRALLMDFATILEHESFEHFPSIFPSVCHVVQFLDLTNIVGRCHNFV